MHGEKEAINLWFFFNGEIFFFQLHKFCFEYSTLEGVYSADKNTDSHQTGAHPCNQILCDSNWTQIGTHHLLHTARNNHPGSTLLGKVLTVWMECNKWNTYLLSVPRGEHFLAIWSRIKVSTVLIYYVILSAVICQMSQRPTEETFLWSNNTSKMAWFIFNCVNFLK